MVTLPINQKYVEAINDKDGKIINDKANDQVNDMIFNSLEDIISYFNDFHDQANDQANDQVQDILNNQLHNKVGEILNTIMRWIKRDELFATMNLSNHYDNYKKYLDALVKIGWVEMEFSNKQTSPNQRYRITVSGKNLLKFLNKKR